MTRFVHCARCGAELHPDEHGGRHCPRCGRTWHDNPSPTVGAVIVRDGSALITQRARKPYQGSWDVPGGFLESGEDPIDGLKRELKEELGITIDSSVADCIDMSPASYGDEGDYVLALGFRARLVAGEPQPSDDVAAFKWVTADEVDEVDFAWEHDRELVRKALRHGKA